MKHALNNLAFHLGILCLLLLLSACGEEEEPAKSKRSIKNVFDVADDAAAAITGQEDAYQKALDVVKHPRSVFEQESRQPGDEKTDSDDGEDQGNPQQTDDEEPFTLADTSKLEGKSFSVSLGAEVGMEMVWIPRGGLDSSSGGFWMGKHEVTQEQYEAMTRKNPSIFKGEKRPVENVSWHDAVRFCELVTQRTRIKHSLPTANQWEYACKAGSTTRFYFGNAWRQLGEYAWYGQNSDDRTHPVGQKKPNAYGLFDMYGNVSEWCLNESTGPGGVTGTQVVGGCWGNDVDCFFKADMGVTRPTYSGDFIGFRVIALPKSDSSIGDSRITSQ